MPEFIKLPVRIAPLKEIEAAEITNADIEWKDGYAIVNIDEIQEISEEPDGNSGITYKSGDTSKIFLSIDEIATLLESK